MISLQTNVDALDALNNLGVDNAAQGKTIQQLSSGYRINSSGDDAAGLAVANSYENQVTQLTQGVNNANDGIAQLQIIDGGLSNISNILNRMQTLASESASGTFSGNRATLDQEYQNLIGEITRQATNIGLNAGGAFNSALNVFIGGSSNASSASVSIDLSGGTSAVDATSLGLSGTNVLGGTVGGVEFSGNAVRLDDPATLFLAGGTQTYSFNYTDANGNTQSRSVVLAGGTNGVNGTSIISQLNNGLAGTGITASINSTDGTVQFASSGAFTAAVAAATAGTDTQTAPAKLANTSQNNLTNTFADVSGNKSEQFTISDGTHTADVTLDTTTGASQGAAVTAINSALASANITDVSALAYGTTGISLQGSANFSVTEYQLASTGGLFTALGAQTVTPATSGGTAGTDAQAAISAIATALSNLGLVQGRVGAGENQLQYAIGLAQSQITNFSTAQGDIKDADIASQASNLTKDQVLEQTAVAALAQANSMPQAVLKLLQ
jgi:flagellin